MHTNNLLGLLPAPTAVGSGDLLGGIVTISSFSLLVSEADHGESNNNRPIDRIITNTYALEFCCTGGSEVQCT